MDERIRRRIDRLAASNVPAVYAEDRAKAVAVVVMPPCGVTGTCSDGTSPWRIRHKTVIIERQYDNAKYKPVITVVIVGEALGL